MGTPLTFNEILSNCVIYSISKAWCLGRTVQRGRLAKTDLVNSILDSVRSKLIINGKVTAKGQLCMYVMQLVACFTINHNHINDNYFTFISTKFNMAVTPCYSNHR